VVIEGILEESRAHYLGQYDRLVARLIHIPRGSLRRQGRNGREYWYLRRYAAGRGYEDHYLGPVGDRAAEALVALVNERGRRADELKAVKDALKQVGVTRVEQRPIGFPDIFRQLLEALGEAGLWQEGLALIGSWCFNVYVQSLGVAFFPLRTMDFDFGLRIPYTGPSADMDALLTRLGFTPRIDMGYGKVDYVLPGVGVVEVFMDRAQGTPERVREIQQRLALRPAPVTHLSLLLNNTITVKVHGVHKAITVPSMPAFLVHRLITARFGEYRDAADNIHKVRKDYKQAALTARRILEEPDLRAELAAIIEGLPDDLQAKMHASAQAVGSCVKAPDLLEEDAAVLRMAVGTQL
jgi:hypothetical protein